MSVFGLLPSRRRGNSLGINTITPKHCPYACVYCQVGRSTDNRIDRRPFFEPAEVVCATAEKLAQARATDVRIDALTIVPDGEPTLDINRGSIIEALHRFGVRVAVISNAFLLMRDESNVVRLLALFLKSSHKLRWNCGYQFVILVGFL